MAKKMQISSGKLVCTAVLLVIITLFLTGDACASTPPVIEISGITPSSTVTVGTAVQIQAHYKPDGSAAPLSGADVTLYITGPGLNDYSQQAKTVNDYCTFSFTAPGYGEYTMGVIGNYGDRTDIMQGVGVKLTVNPSPAPTATPKPTRIQITTTPTTTTTPTPVPSGRIIDRNGPGLLLPSITPTPVPQQGSVTVTPVPQIGGQTSGSTPQPTPVDSPEYATILANDNVAPVSTLNLTGTTKANGEYTSNVICTLSARDENNGSGVNMISYSFDGNTWVNYTTPFTITKAGTTNLFYKAVDNAGNEEIALVKTITLAGDAPDTSPTAKGSPAPGMITTALAIIGVAGLLLLSRNKK